VVVIGGEHARNAEGGWPWRIEQQLQSTDRFNKLSEMDRIHRKVEKPEKTKCLNHAI